MSLKPSSTTSPSFTLKRKIYTESQVQDIFRKKGIDLDIIAGGPGEAFAVCFYLTRGTTNVDFKEQVGKIAMLLDKDKPFAKISTVKLVKHKNRPCLRVGWTM